mmetsp:Transcript_2032/g.9196  ORF Transcript_2032/g.9196 Transcript_2032/m.9196 type:complete len:319 (-) Transcript_2032:109-1065(-)
MYSITQVGEIDSSSGGPRGSPHNLSGGQAKMCSLLLQMRYWRTSSSPRRRRLTHAARPPERPMASSSSAPARRLSFHACLARSMASLAASISAAVNRLVAKGPGARMFTTSSTCLSTPVFFATFPAPPRAPRRSAPATDDAMPMTRDNTPDIDDTGTVLSSVVGICERSDSDQRPVRAPVANLASLGDARDVVARVLVALEARSVQPQAHVPAVGAFLDLVRALTNARGFHTVRDQLPGRFVELGGAVELLSGLQGDLVQVPRAGQARAAAHVLDVADTERPARVVAQRVEAVHLAPMIDETHVPVPQLHVNAVAVPA